MHRVVGGGEGHAPSRRTNTAGSTLFPDYSHCSLQAGIREVAHGDDLVSSAGLDGEGERSRSPARSPGATRRSRDVVNWQDRRCLSVMCSRREPAIASVRRGMGYRPRAEGHRVRAPAEPRAAADEREKVSSPCQAAMMPHGRARCTPRRTWSQTTSSLRRGALERDVSVVFLPVFGPRRAS